MTERTLDKKIIEKLVERLKEMRKIHKQVTTLRREISSLTNELDIVMGSWECSNSPFEVCVYDINDGPQDYCLYCNEPDERD